MGNRRRARELTLQALYKTDLLDQWDKNALEEIQQTFPTREPVFTFAQLLFQEIGRNRIHIDKTLQEYADNWSISRMNIVDRNIMRIAAYEILFCEDIPKRVSIHEAIELAKLYGSKDTGGFLNGILDRIDGSRRSDNTES